MLAVKGERNPAEAARQHSSRFFVFEWMEYTWLSLEVVAIRSTFISPPSMGSGGCILSSILGSLS
jgi:hypothetical protein